MTDDPDFVMPTPETAPAAFLVIAKTTHKIVDRRLPEEAALPLPKNTFVAPVQPGKWRTSPADPSVAEKWPADA